MASRYEIGRRAVLKLLELRRNWLDVTGDGISMKTTCLLLMLAVSALARADVVLDWNEVTLAAIQRTSTPPPVAARALAMTHVAIYDAVNSIEPTHQSFRVYSAVSPTTSREAAAAQAAFRVLAAALSHGAGSFGERARQQSGAGPGRT